MRTLFLSFVFLAVACRTSPLVFDVDGGPATDGGNSDLNPKRVPLVHRPIPVQCKMDRPSANCPTGVSTGPTPECQLDSECTAGVNGRCISPHFVCLCSYDSCFGDSECGAGTLCNCHGMAGDHASTPNHCVTAGCHVDADCGPSGYCSPSLDPDCGAYIGITSWRCHTPSDTCVDDSDCPGSAGFAACVYQPGLGRWACISQMCL